ncbi:tetratricopeptide repeat protein [Vibrio palustris]|uniref:Tetratricopeptide repeat protein n=1 Tax=Vibrio palustris TaxID=1918946 RepID=A0A1R4B2P2_9VIBR|nr:tetratricopeptide repeat protein [Vibrio palustris]SJL83178.1 Tetratricopeptide repeat protein [Vibrio palustris]
MRKILTVLLASLTLLLTNMVTSTAVYAKSKPQLSDYTYRVVNSVQRLIALKKYSDAHEKLQHALEGASRKFDKAVLMQQIGYLYSMQDNYPKAIEYFAKAIKSQGLPVEVAQQVRYALGQLYLAQEQYKESIATLQQWFAVSKTTEEKPQSSAYVLLASAYAQVEDYRHVVAPMKQAIKLSDSPSENWYLLLMAAYHELGQYQNMVGVLKSLTTQYPTKKRYWTQLSGAYMELEQEKKALAALEMPYNLGLMTDEKEILRLSNFEAFMSIPYRAATILETAMQQGNVERSAKHVEQLGSFYHQAQELDKAIESYQDAYQMAPTWDAQQRITKLMLQNKDYQGVLAFAQTPSPDANADNKAELKYLTGMAYFELHKTSKALEAMKKAVQSKEVKPMAQAWISYLQG